MKDLNFMTAIKKINRKIIKIIRKTVINIPQTRIIYISRVAIDSPLIEYSCLPHLSPINLRIAILIS